MRGTTTIRVSLETRDRINRLAAARHETSDQTVARAIRALRQAEMGRSLATDLTPEEKAWLDADAG